MAVHALIVKVGGVSKSIAGPIRIEADESSARVADVTIRAEQGNPEDWVGQTVLVTFDGTTLFSGKCNRPFFDATNGILRLQCSDLLQEVFEAYTEAEVESAIPDGVWSTAIFSDREDGWQQALDMLSTWPGEIHLNNAGSVVTASWESPGGTPRLYDASGHEYGTVRPEFAARRDLVNSVSITFQVRFTRRHHREHIFQWDYDHSDFCDYYQNTHDLPSREMIQTAAEGAVWKIQNGYISYSALPDSGIFTCGGGPVAWSITDEAQRQLATTAAWTAVRRWSQTITETYNLTVSSSASIARYGTIEQEDQGSYAEEYPDDSWDADQGTETPSGGSWTSDAIGDYVSDEVTRATANTAIECICAIAKTRILETHRRNNVIFDVPLEPSIDLADTATVTDLSINATGKVAQFIHQIDPEAGRAVTTIKLACFRGGGGSSDTITAPSPPDTAPGYSPPTSTHVLGHHIGGATGVPPYDETWDGFTGNYALIAQGSETYPLRFRVVTDDIEDAARDEVAESTSASFNVGAPDDTLAIDIP